MTRRKSHAFDLETVGRYNIETYYRKNTKKNRLWIISVKTANCLCNALILNSHRMLARSQSSVGKFEIIGHLQQMVHDTHEFYSKIINEIWHLSVLLLRLPLKTHIWSYCLMKRVEQCYFKALKTGFVENKGQSGPLSADSNTQGKCQLSVKILAVCQLSVNPIQTLIFTQPKGNVCFWSKSELKDQQKRVDKLNFSDKILHPSQKQSDLQLLIYDVNSTLEFSSYRISMARQRFDVPVSFPVYFCQRGSGREMAMV